MGASSDNFHHWPGRIGENQEKCRCNRCCGVPNSGSPECRSGAAALEPGCSGCVSFVRQILRCLVRRRRVSVW